MKRLLMIFFILFSLFLFVTSTKADISNLNPVEDSVVNSKSHGTNFGSSLDLGADSSPIIISYLKFNLSPLNGASITSAKLRLTVTSSSGSTQNIKQVADNNWSESTITYNNRPALGNLIVSVPRSKAVGSIFEADITLEVSSKLGQIMSIAIDSSGSDDIGFYSKENPTGKPELVINYTPSGPDTTPPTVSITSPLNGATVSGTITVTATASDNIGVSGVQFLLDGANLGAEDTTAPYLILWDTTAISDGLHTLTSRASDTSNNAATSTAVTVTVSNIVDITSPNTSITSPTSGSNVSGTITVSANASDNIGVAGVQFLVDGVNLGAEDTTFPYSVSWDTTTAVNGSHTLTAVARDAAGNMATSISVIVNVSKLARPNIIVVMTDNQDKRSVNEAMSKVQQLLVQNGVSFENAFVSYPLCCPSRATFLSGQYAHNHGILDNVPPKGGYGKFDHTKTLATWLQADGYYTVHIGKYLNGYGQEDNNLNNSIPACLEIPSGWNEWYTAAAKWDYFYDFVVNENGALIGYGNPPSLGTGCPVTVAPSIHQTDLYAQKMTDFITKRGNATDKKPFFLVVDFGAPHGNGNPPPRHIGKFGTAPLPIPPSFNEADVSDKPAPVRSLRLLSSSKINSITKEYRKRLELLLGVDEAVESMINALNSTSQLQNTVIIFTSDQGQLMGEHRINSEGLGWQYEESVKVPLIIYGPNIPVNQTRNHVVANIDFASTILELAQAQVTPTLVQDGRSFVPLLNDPLAPWRTAVLLHSEFRSNRNYRGVHTLQYVYIEQASSTEKEFYDLATDPYQLQSQHANPSNQTIIASLKNILNILKTCSGSSCWQ